MHVSPSSLVGSTETSESDHVVDLTEVVEHQTVSASLLRLVFLSWMITFLDGFDSSVLSFVAPYLAPDLGLSKIELGNIFGIGLAGTMAGGIFFGYIGDRMGRRPALLATAASFGFLTMAFSLVRTVDELMLLRLVTGIAVGGALPVAWALNIEFVPHNYRATVVTLVMLGFSFGAAAAGPMTLLLAPSYGWQAVFFTGGLMTLIACIPLAFGLPESLHFLIEKDGPRRRIMRSVKLMFPDLVVTPSTIFTVSKNDERSRSFHLRDLFTGKLRQITPWLWLAYIASSVTVFFLASWSPIVLEGVGFSRGDAVAIVSATAAGGALGGIGLMRFTDLWGPVSIIAMPVIALPLLVILGLVPLGQSEFAALYFLITFFLVGGHYGMHSVAGLYYPTQIRANGAGWAVSVAKIGSIAGPILGGLLLSTHLPTRSVFCSLSVFPAIMALCVLVLVRSVRQLPPRQVEPSSEKLESMSSHSQKV